MALLFFGHTMCGFFDKWKILKLTLKIEYLAARLLFI